MELRVSWPEGMQLFMTEVSWWFRVSFIFEFIFVFLMDRVFIFVFGSSVFFALSDLKSVVIKIQGMNA